MQLSMPWTSWVTLAVLVMYIWIIFKVANARGKHQIHAPFVDGPPEFLRALRVQANTVEQLVFFIPALWLCAYWWNDKVAAAGGVVWLIGRVMYAIGYYREAAKRSTGFMVATLAAFALVFGTVY
ncbi:MAG: MAPEG family protein, partial [Pseudomonadota bacterium]